MKNIYAVVISVSGKVWGVWTLPNKPTTDQRVLLSQFIRRTLDRCGMKEEPYSTDYTDNLECDNFAELTSGVVDSLLNEFDD